MTNNKATKTGFSKRLILFKKNLPLLLLALPGLVVLITMRYFPMFGLVLPFKNYKYDLGFWKSEWVGLKNFEFLFKSDDVLVATRNTILYNAVFIVVMAAIAVIIALLLYELSARAVKVYQTILYLPHFVSWVVAAFIVNALFDMDFGFVNRVLTSFGLEPNMWYNDAKYWPWIIIVSNLWKCLGSTAIMYYAALIGISPDYYEAAKIDGAGKLKQIWHISIPMIKNVIIVLFILNVGKIMFADFGLFYNVPMNSPLLYDTTDVLDTYVYRALMNMGNIGMSSAAAFYQAVVGFVLVVVTNLVVKKVDPESGLF